MHDAEDAADDPLVGRTLGESYRIVRAIGEGGMGTVYEAQHARISTRRFAVKALHPEYVRNPKAVARFKREAEAAASIDNPHVVGVFDVGTTDDGTHYIVNELLEGEELGDHLDRVGRMRPAELVRLVRQVCRGLAAAHARGVVHRDMKPENVFLTGDPAAPTARVLDFGISRVETEGTQLTKTGMIMGTPAYMAPEQAKGVGVDERVDVYATGALLYRGLTGCMPFDRPEPAAMIAAVLLEEPTPMRELDPTIDPGLELVVQRAMSKDPDARYRTISELDEALAPFDVAEVTPTPTLASPTAIAPVAAPNPSVTNLTMQANDIRYARSQLLIHGVVVGCCTFIAIWTLAGAAAALARGGPEGTLSLTESALVALTLVLVGLTPAYLLARRLRELWANTMKTLAKLEVMRTAVLGGALAYGGAWLIIRTVEVSVLRSETGAAWAGWDVMLLPLACAVGIAAARRKNLGLRGLPSAAFIAVAAALLTLTTTLAAVVRTEPDGAELADDDDAPDDDEGRERKQKAPARAPAAALSSARTAGVASLAALREKYPKDAAVVEALALAQSKSPKHAGEAVKTVAHLLKLDRKAAERVPIQQLVRSAALAGHEPALSLMKSEMGSHGPDLLYELRNRPELKARIAPMLKDVAVVERASPALRVALELQAASTCDEVAKLLDRATKEGDKRALPVLQPYVASRSYKCGFLNLKTCHKPPKCPANTLAINQAILAIRGRDPG